MNGKIQTSYKYFDSEQWTWQSKVMIWANSPVVKDDMIFLSIGYNFPAKMLKVNEEVSAIEEVYRNVGLVKPDPSGFKLISSFQVEKGSDPHWSHPYLLDGKMFLRHGDVLMVCSLRDS